MPGQRLVVIASPGFLAETAEAISEKAEILDAAAHANVMISALNARRLFTTNIDASQSGSYSPTTQTLISQYFEQSAIATEDVLAELAEGTGGTFFHNNNDLNEGFARVAAAPEVSYVLGFSPHGYEARWQLPPLESEFSRTQRHGHSSAPRLLCVEA